MMPNHSYEVVNFSIDKTLLTLLKETCFTYGNHKLLSKQQAKRQMPSN